jgi:tetratricopeptide (TPR) repeat protein
VAASPAISKVPAARTFAAPASPARNEKFAIAGILGATFLTYASTIPFGWVYDDPAQIPNNPDLHWNRLAYLFSHQLWAYLPGSDARFYRPLLSLWFLINKTVFGVNAPGFHLTTVLMHVAATALAYVLARRLLRNGAAALIVATIFGLHPLHAETAAWISDVDDSLAAVFCFGAFLSYLNARTRPQQAKQWWAVSLGCYTLGLLTKEVVLLLPIIILLDAWSRRLPGRTRTVAVAGISYGSVALAYIAIRSAVLGTFIKPQPAISTADALLTAPRLALFYAEKILAPFGLSANYEPVHAISARSMGFWLPALILSAIIAGAAVLYFRWLRGSDLKPRSFPVAMGWLIIPMLPALNLALLVQQDPLHDRYAYISVFGAALLAAAIWLTVSERWPAAVTIARPLFFAIAVAMAFGSAIQSQFWANDSVLFARAITIAPHNPWPHWNYGAALNRRGKYAEALAEFAASYELAADFRTAAAAGLAAEQLERWPEAEEWLRRSLRLNEETGESWFQMGHLFIAEHRPAHAVPYLKRAVQLAPSASGYHYDLASALEQTGRDSEALDQYLAEVAVHPEQAAAQEGVKRLEGRLHASVQR